MSDINPINDDELPEGKEDAINADPFQQELEGGGDDTDLEEGPGEETARENVEAELDDRLQHGGQERL